jgi:probable poly-beta-1,6-N-acetyl-D-glucosamine export protein
MWIKIVKPVANLTRYDTARARLFLRADYSSPRFLNDIHRLRAIAILFIVTIHCTYFFDWRNHLPVQEFLSDFFDNSTFLFVFIAGFLFQYLNRSFVYPNYLLHKMRNVGMPYLFAAAPAVVYALVTSDAVRRFSELQGHSIFYITAWLLVYGGATLNYALWFMPIIFLYYFATPLFHLFQKQPALYGVLVLLIPLSLYGHRPTYEHGHNLVLALYFLPVYLLGMFFSQFRRRLEPLLDKYLVAVVGLYVVVLVGHFVLSEHHGKYTFDKLFSARQGVLDWLFLQQMLMVFAFYGITKRLKSRKLSWLDFLAEVSFTVYFVHLYVLQVLKHLTRNYTFDGGVGNLAILLALTVIISCGVALATRVIFGRHSRSISGS